MPGFIDLDMHGTTGIDVVEMSVREMRWWEALPWRLRTGRVLWAPCVWGLPLVGLMLSPKQRVCAGGKTVSELLGRLEIREVNVRVE